MKKKSLFIALLPLVLFACGEKFQSDVTLPRIISEGMVLQRDQPISIWGKGIPGENVRVSLAGVMASTEVESDSTWKVGLPSVPAGGPHVMKVNLTEVKDVYFGDVWLAGGQSNMEWPLKSGVVGAEAEYETGGNPQIRFFKVPRIYAAVKKSDIPEGEWKVADSVHMPDFSAVAWFFAKRNAQEKNVPVGIIESNWGGTPAEGWTDAEILSEMKEMSFQEEAMDMIENQEKWDRDFQANDKRREMRDILVHHPDSATARKVAAVDYNDTQWSKINLPSENPLSDIAWVRKSFQLSSNEDVTLIFPTIDQMAFIYINGQLVHHKDWGAAMPEIPLPSDLLFEGKNILTIRAVNTWNNRPVIGSKDQMYLLQAGKKVSLEGGWSYSNSIVEPKLPEVSWQNWKPGAMYNAMIYPLINYGIRGVIWYQGESNAGRAEEYQELFETMITNWRTSWDLPEMPFLFVQLANFMERKELQPDSQWAALRDAQTGTLELPQTGMAVIIDIGEAEDIHPRNKKDVGERLWLQARKTVYGEDLIASGPVKKSIYINGATLTITYESVSEGLQLVVDGDVKGFILRNEAGKWISVSGTISGKDQVQIKLPEGFNPVEIRYAWADNPEVNLINSEGLPAWPFRMDLE